MKTRGINIALSIQFIEIYDEQGLDLLTGNQINIKRENGELVGATEVNIDNLIDVMATLRKGHARKKFAATAMNERSSRSHTAVVIQVLQTKDNLSNSNNNNEDEQHKYSDKLIKSHLHLIDLAGSERINKSKAEGSRLKEAVGINSSLLVLG